VILRIFSRELGWSLHITVFKSKTLAHPILSVNIVFQL